MKKTLLASANFFEYLLLLFLMHFLSLPVKAQTTITNFYKPLNIGLINNQPAADNNAVSTSWLLEPVDNFYRIKNAATGEYLNNQNGVLACSKIDPGWWSAQWTLKSIDDKKFIINRWTGDYLHIEHGPLELGKIASEAWWSARWILNTSTSNTNVASNNSSAITAGEVLTPISISDADDTSAIYEDVPDMPKADVQAVMYWLKVKVTGEKLPFCWRQSYGRGVGEVAGDCPAGTEKNGALCYPLCDNGYAGNGPVCWQSCPSGFRDDGAFCAKPAAYGRGSGYAIWNEKKCNDENPQGCEKNGAMWYPKCKENFHATGCCICSPDCPPGFGTDIGVSCTKKSYGRGAGTVLECPQGTIRDETGGPVGLCYPKCRPGFHGVGPVCWQDCDPSWNGCGAGCAKSSLDCGLTTFDQVMSVATVAANIAIICLAGPAGGEAATLVEEGVKTSVTVGVKSAEAGTGLAVKGVGAIVKSQVGQLFVSAVEKLQSIKPANLEAGANVFKRIYQARTGTKLSQTITTAKVVKTSYKALADYKKAFADNFAEQTSAEIEKEIDNHFNAQTARYLKEYWGNQQIVEMAEANHWQIAQTAMAVVSIIDITGVTGLVASFTKPICKDVVPFPTLSQQYK